MSVIRTLRKGRKPRTARCRRSERARLLVLLAAAGMLAGAPSSATGQDAPPPSLSQLRDQLEVAQEAYEAALAVMNLDRNELVEVFRELPESRAADVRAWEEGMTRYLAASLEADESEARARRTKQVLDSVKALLADRLVARRDSLAIEFAGLPPGEGDGLRARIRDLGFEIEELRPPPQPPSVVFAFRAPVAYDRRDGPDQLRGKIQIAERLLEEQDSSIVYWEGQMDQLEELIRQERRLGDFRNQLGLFGDTRTPTINNPARGDDEPTTLPADSTAVQQQPPTPEELLERYRSILNNTRRYREAIAENLAELRVVLGRIGAR